MDDLRSLFIGVLGGLIVWLIIWTIKRYLKKSLLNDIELLEFEKEHLQAMKRSSVEMNRSSFRAVFALFLIFGIASITPHIFSFISPNALSSLSSFFSVVFWGMFIGVSAKLWQRYDNLKNYKEAVIKIDVKLAKLQSKLSSS
jgi:hypothetical protein